MAANDTVAAKQHDAAIQSETSQQPRCKIRFVFPSSVWLTAAHHQRRSALTSAPSGACAVRPFSCAGLSGNGADLLEYGRHVKVLAEFLDPIPVDGNDLRAPHRPRLAGGRDGAEGSGLRPGPGDFDLHRVPAGEGIADRSLAVRTSQLPALVGLYELVSSLKPALTAHLVVDHIWR